MPLSEANLAKARAIVSANAGGYLRNVIREAYATCAVCATPVNGYVLCFACSQAAGTDGLADRVGSITYAIAGTQSAHLMRGYKAQPASQQHQAMVMLLLGIAVDGHASCLNRISGVAVSLWASVPSLPPKDGEHPLHRLARGVIGLNEVPLGASTHAVAPRDVNGEHFATSSRLPSDSHVLLIDDTWTRGGHAQSAAIALHAAGASQVSVLTLARWIEPTYADNKQFIGDRLTGDFDPTVCPWTAGECP